MCHGGELHFVPAETSFPGCFGCQTDNGHCNIYRNEKWRNASMKKKMSSIIIFIPISICCVLPWTGMCVAEERQRVLSSSIREAKCCYNNSIWWHRTVITADLLNICCVLAIIEHFQLKNVNHNPFSPLNAKSLNNAPLQWCHYIVGQCQVDAVHL